MAPRSETPITLPDMRPGVAEMEWMVVSAVHTLGAGYTTRIEVETKTK